MVGVAANSSIWARVSPTSRTFAAASPPLPTITTRFPSTWWKAGKTLSFLPNSGISFSTTDGRTIPFPSRGPPLVPAN
jgi:hypothetical protein